MKRFNWQIRHKNLLWGRGPRGGGWVGLNIFGHQEGKEHKLTRILIQPQLLSKFKPKKMQVLRYYIFSFSNWHWTPWSISLIQSTRERKFFCNFKLFRPLWQLLHSLRTNLRRKLGECTIILHQLSQKTGLIWKYESQSMLIIRNCAKNVHMVKSLSSIKWIKKCHKTANPKWLISLLKLLRLLMTHLPGVIERFWQKPATRQLCHLFDLR